MDGREGNEKLRGEGGGKGGGKHSLQSHAMNFPFFCGHFLAFPSSAPLKNFFSSQKSKSSHSFPPPQSPHPFISQNGQFGLLLRPARLFPATVHQKGRVVWLQIAAQNATKCNGQKRGKKGESGGTGEGGRGGGVPGEEADDGREAGESARTEREQWRRWSGQYADATVGGEGNGGGGRGERSGGFGRRQ